MTTPTGLNVPCPNLDKQDDSSNLYYTDVINETGLEATPLSTPQHFATIVDKGTYGEWAPKQEMPAVIMQKRKRCTDPTALCSYHGMAVTGLKLQTITMHVTTTVTLPGNVAAPDDINDMYLYMPTQDGPVAPVFSFGETTDERFDLNLDGSKTWTMTYGDKTIMKHITYEISSGILAADGTRIVHATLVDTIGGNTTFRQTDTRYKSGEMLVIFNPCLRYEYMDLNSDTTVDTHNEIFTEYGTYLGWKG